MRAYRGNIIVPEGRPVLNKHAGKVEPNIQANAHDPPARQKMSGTAWNSYGLTIRDPLRMRDGYAPENRSPRRPGFCSCGKQGLEYISWKCRQCWLSERHEQKLVAHREMQKQNQEQAERARRRREEMQQALYKPRGMKRKEQAFLKVRDKQQEKHRQEFARDMRKPVKPGYRPDKSAIRRTQDAAIRNGVLPEQARHLQKVRNQDKYVPILNDAGNPGAVYRQSRISRNTSGVYAVHDPKDWEFDF